jgi:tRNA(adenine34) deaminase
MLKRCIALARTATDAGEDPFACIICDGDRVVAEATTRTRRDGDVTRHAEILAISEAQKTLGGHHLRRCTIYCTVEPCAMCAYCIRATRIGRVVYAISSPLMGGRSRWYILGDTEISDAMPEVFGRPPEVIGGLLEDEAERLWRGWHPVDWAVLRHRRALGKLDAPASPTAEDMSAPPRRGSIWRLLRSLFGGAGG